MTVTNCIPSFSADNGHGCKYCGRIYTHTNYLEAHLKRCPMLVSYERWNVHVVGENTAVRATLMCTGKIVALDPNL